MQTKLFDELNLKIFLSHLLAKKSTTQLEGIFNRFPLIWVQRTKFPHSEHFLLNDPVLKTEFFKKFAYALIEVANQDLEIQKELHRILKQLNPSLVKKIQNSPLPQLNQTNLIIDLIAKKTNHSVPTLLSELALIDYWMTYYKKEYLLSDKLTNFLEKEITPTLKSNTQKSKNQSLHHQLISDKNGKENPWFKRYFKQFETYLGEPLSRYLTAISNDFTHYFYSSNHERLTSLDYQFYNMLLDDRLLIHGHTSTLNQQDALEVFARVFRQVMVFHRTVEKKIEANLALSTNTHTHPIDLNEIDQSLMPEFKTLLPLALLDYLIYKNKTNDRTAFYSLTESQLMRSESVRKTLEKQTRQLEKFEQLVEQLTQQLNQYKETKQAELQQALLKKEQILLEQERQIEKLQKNYQTLESDYQALKERYQDLLSSVEEQVSSDTEDLPLLNPLTSEDQTEILIIGGAPSLIQRLKEQLPQSQFYGWNQTLPQLTSKPIKYGFILKRLVNHTMVRQIQKQLPTIELIDLETINPSRILSDIQSYLSLKSESE